MSQARGSIAGNSSTGMLKVIALVCMFADHAGKMLLPGIPEMRIIGRIAFPLYCWCLVVGFQHTRSVGKYALRLLAIGLISQPLYMLALNHTWREPNIFLTLLLGLCALWGIREKKAGSQFWAPLGALALAIACNCSYGWRGVLFILLLYAVRDTRSGIAAVMVAFCLYWGTTSSAVNSLFGLSLTPLVRSPLGTLISPFLRLQGLALLALPLILIPMPRLRMPKWLGYALYPAHLLLLYLLELIC